MDTNPAISVACICYNFEKYIEECIQSLLNQSLKPFEIIICDDCSKDNSWEIISGYAEKYPDLIRAYRHVENIGQVKNGTFAQKKIRGEFMVSMDGDDRWHPRKLELEMQALRDNPEAKIAYSNVQVIDEDGYPLKVWKNGASGDLFYRIFYRQVFSTTGNVFRNELMHKSVYECLIDRDENVKIMQDLDFRYRAASRFKIVCTGETLVYYRQHGGGIHNCSAEELDRDNLIIYKKILPIVSKREGPEAQDMRVEVERRIGIIESQLKYELTYHVPYAELCRKALGFEGKDILEVGGSLPKAYVFAQLKARSWSCVESPEYALFNKDQPNFSLNKNKGSNMPNISECTETGFKDTKLPQGQYNLFYANIEDLPEEHFSRYDLVFSIAAFEHIHKFPQALDKMYMALKPGGKLFAMFSPIWSAHNGHRLPDIRDKYGKLFNYSDSPIPAWGHLIMRPADLCQYLYRFTDKETADLMVYHVYNSPQINRFFTEDYMRFFRQSRFKIIKMEDTFFCKTQDKTQAILEGLYPGRSRFTNNGMQVILERPMEDPGDMAEVIYLNQQGEDLFEREKTEAAFEMFNKAIQLHPGYAPAHNNLAVMLWHADKISQALTHFKKALEIDPNNRDAVINSARCLESISEIEAAKDICTTYLKDNQVDGEVAQILSGLGG